MDLMIIIMIIKTLDFTIIMIILISNQTMISFIME
jgi:hypothetical protein